MGFWKILNTAGTAVDIETTHAIRVLFGIGVGMPAVQNTITKYGLIDGGKFQRSIVPPRELILQCITLTHTQATFHDGRQGLIDLVKRDRQAAEGPVKIRYVVGASTFEIEGYYSGGLEMGAIKKTYENFNIQFICEDPFWHEITTNTTALNINSTTVITNTGTAQAYPSFVFAGTGNITQISNDTTGKVLNFNGLSVTGSEIVTISLAPPTRTISSDVRGNLLANVANGSNLSTWALNIGANTVSVAADAEFALSTLAGDEIGLLEGGDVLGLLESGSLNLTTKNIAYANRHWSVDGV